MTMPTTLTVGQPIPSFAHPAIDGSLFSSASLAGRTTLITFFRFATCPFCNLRMNQMLQRAQAWGDRLAMVALFESPLETLQKHQGDRHAPFPILADARRTSYRNFGVTRSVAGMLRGMVFRFPTLLRGMAQGYIPREISARLLTMPASFLVDREGRLVEAWYGKDEGDHIPWERVERFVSAAEGLSRRIEQKD
jgi:peroxiredoxin Q/BCP